MSSFPLYFFYRSIFSLLSDISKESTCNLRDPGSIPVSERSSGEGNRKPLQYSCLENSRDRGVWWAAFHGVTKSWTQRIDAFELWCWRRLLRVSWTARRSSQSILKDISPECSLEELMLKLELQYFATWCEELTHWKRLWCWERLRAWGEGDNRGWDGWMASLTQWTWVWVSSGSWWWTGKPGVLQSMGSQRVRHAWATELNWTEPWVSDYLDSNPGSTAYIT